MKLALADLDPHFLKRASRLNYEHTDDINEADGLEIKCPACYWADRRIGGDNLSHVTVLWADPEHWAFIGHGYGDLSLMAGRVMVTLTGGHCHTRFYIKDGKVDFY